VDIDDDDLSSSDRTEDSQSLDWMCVIDVVMYTKDRRNNGEEMEEQMLIRMTTPR
jgi:hypothetical protein